MIIPLFHWAAASAVVSDPSSGSGDGGNISNCKPPNKTEEEVCVWCEGLCVVWPSEVVALITCVSVFIKVTCSRETAPESK